MDGAVEGLMILEEDVFLRGAGASAVPINSFSFSSPRNGVGDSDGILRVRGQG